MPSVWVTLGHPQSIELVLVCSGCHNGAAQTGGLTYRHLFLPGLKLEVQDLGASMVGSGEDPLSSCRGRLLTVPLPGGREEGAVWGPFCKGTHPTREGCPS